MRNGEGFKKWLLPSVADIIFVAILFISFGGVAKDFLFDGDTGYHIRAGDYIIQNLTIPKEDIFSYRSPALEWTAHEWLSEVIFSVVHGVSGLTGIVLVSSVIVASVYFFLMKFLRAAGINIIAAALLVVLVSLASAIHWLARPHIFSLLLTLVFYAAIDSYQNNADRKNLLYFLPPLMLVWVNLHGGFFAGLMLLAVYIAGNSLSILFGGGPTGGARERLKWLGIVFGLCVLAALANPKGVDMLLYPFRLVGDKFLMDNVDEWLSPNFHKAVIFESMLLLMILVFGASGMRLSATEALLVILFTHMSLYSARYIPLYALVVSPIMGRRIEHIIQASRERWFVRRLTRLSENVSKTDSMTKGHAWPVLAVAVAIFLALTGRVSHEFDRGRFPVEAVQFIKQEKIPGNMFSSDEFGDYVIYSAWPEYRVFIDGRLDMYGAESLKDYFKIVYLNKGWREVLDKYDINWIMYYSGSILSACLLESEDWKLIYADKVANIFIRNTPENAGLIEKYRDVRPLK